MSTDLHTVLSAKYIEPASTRMELMIDATIEGERDTFPFVYDPRDIHGDMNPQVTAWLMSNPDFPIEPFTG